LHGYIRAVVRIYASSHSSAESPSFALTVRKSSITHVGEYLWHFKIL
jgi:hypothetical protein